MENQETPVNQEQEQVNVQVDTGDEIEVESPEQNTRAYYLQQAANLGLTLPKNIRTDKLVETVGNRLNALKQQNKRENRSSIAAEQFQDQSALVRIRIAVLNPAKQNWSGEIFTVGNDVIPHIKRFIPFNAEGGIWHVERMFIPLLKSRKYQHMVEHSGMSRDNYRKYGVDLSKNKLLPEFHIEELPPLTKEELDELASMQAANNSLQD